MRSTYTYYVVQKTYNMLLRSVHFDGPVDSEREQPTREEANGAW
jgi:hypothetical protein